MHLIRIQWLEVNGYFPAAKLERERIEQLRKEYRWGSGKYEDHPHDWFELTLEDLMATKMPKRFAATFIAEVAYYKRNITKELCKWWHWSTRDGPIYYKDVAGKCCIVYINYSLDF